MKKFALMTNYSKDRDLFYTNNIRDYIVFKGGSCWLPKPISEYYTHDADKEHYYDLTDMPDDIECVIVLGGDGTLLQVARELYKKDLFIIGANIGTLGFLTAVEKSEINDCIDALLKDEFLVDERMMIHGSVYHGDVEGKTLNIALNDIIIARAGFSRLVELKVWVNGELLNVMCADGVIISTPTGSTGYNLSAGGPIVFPQTDSMIITPICPHSLQVRSIVVSGNDVIEVEVGRRRKTQEEEAIVTFDGHIAEKLKSGDRIKIYKAKETTRLARLRGQSFYKVLQSKIGNV